MKRVVSLLLVVSLLCAMAPMVFAEEGGIVDVTDYSYEVMPLLSPFYYYIYVRTDNPDPYSFRLVDKTCIYYTEDSVGRIEERVTANMSYSTEVDPGTYYISTYVYPDVAYEDESCYRVKGGYIFRADDAYSDGGEFVLLQKTYSSGSILHDSFKETDVTVPCAPMQSTVDFLISQCTTEEMGFFEKLDAVQSYLNANAVYPRGVYDSSKPSARPYPCLAASPYPELGLNEHYEMFQQIDSYSLLSMFVYPFVLDSLGVPGTLSRVARTLEPSCTVASGSTHAYVSVTFDGTTKSYGGAGRGGYDPLYTNRVQKSFLFDGSEQDIGIGGTVERYSELLLSYGKPAAEDAKQYRDLISGATFRNTIAASGGTWMRIAVEGFLSSGTSFAYAVPTYYGTTILSEAWVDGRYIGKHERVELGATFADHPLADIVLTDFTFTDRDGVEHTKDALFLYSEYKDYWYASDIYYNYCSTGSGTMPPEFILTQEEVAAMDLDYNTNSWPTEGLVYDGMDYPGTPFKHSQVEQVLVPESVSVHVGETLRIPINMLPEDAFDTYFTMNSSDPSVVEVTDSYYGDMIRGVSEGTATLTITARDGGAQATCAVTVLPALCEVHTCDISALVAPTFEEEGSFHCVCSVCHLEEDVTLPPLDDYVYSVREITKATCQAEGEAEYTWGEEKYGTLSFQVTLPVTDHLYNKSITYPTCTEGGYTTYSCNYCNDSYVGDYTDPTGHDYLIYTCEPTCYSEGYTLHFCWYCEDSYTTDETPMVDHEYTVTVVPPTCTEEGYTKEVCKYGHGTWFNYVAELGHDWSEWVTVTEPSSMQAGLQERYCSRCDDVEQKTLAALSNPFTDIRETDYFYAPVLWALQNGITYGTSATEFSPEETCTRAQVVTFLWRACGSPEPQSAKNPFADVKESMYYYKAVLWAVENGITAGTSTTTFSPDDACTRAQVAAFLHRAQGEPEPEQSGTPFTDVANNAYYYKAVLWAVENGITYGTGNGKFSPDDPCTRGQIVCFLYRALNK